MNCTSCAREMHHSARHPVCMTCRSNRCCSDCGARVSYRSSGRCVTCANRALRLDKGHVERQAAAMVAFNTDPARAEARRAGARKAVRTKAKCPETMAKMSEAGKRNGPRNIAATRSPEVRARAGRSISEVKQAQRRVRLAWCPPERLAEYERLCSSYPVAEARRIIEADEQRRRRDAIDASHRRMLEGQSRTRALRIGGGASA